MKNLKLILYGLMILGILSIVNATPWELNEAEWVSSFTFGFTEDRGMYFHPNGTDFYIVRDTSNNSVSRYSMTTAWDITTASYVSTFDVGSQETSPDGVFFHPNGIYMYITGSQNNGIVQYSLSTPWDITTATNISFYSIPTLNLRSIYISPDGLNYVVAGTTTTPTLNYVSQFTGTSAWNISTITGTMNNLSVENEFEQTFSTFLHPYGQVMYVFGTIFNYPVPQLNLIEQYSLSTAWNPSTATNLNINYTGTSANGTDPQAIFISPDGTKLFVSAGNQQIQYYNLYDNIAVLYQYSQFFPLNTTYTVDSANTTIGGEASVGAYIIDNASAYAGYPFSVLNNSEDIFNNNDGNSTDVTWEDNKPNFNGSAFITVGSVSNFNNLCTQNDGCTIVARVTPSSARTTESAEMTIFAKYDTSGNQRWFRLSLQDPGRVIGAFGNGTQQGAVATSADSLWSVGEEIDVALVINRTSGRHEVYLNCVPLANDISATYNEAALLAASEMVFVGAQDDAGSIGSWARFNGSMDYVYTYAIALSEEELCKIHNNGTYTTDELGDANASIDLNGVDEYVLTNVPADTINAGTISLWFKTTDATGGDVISISEGANDLIRINPQANTSIRFIIDDFSGTKEIYQLDTWYHAVLAWNGTNVNTYVDGQFSQSGSYSAQAKTNDFVFGAFADYTGAFSINFNGTISKVRFYDTELSAEEISQIYSYEGFTYGFWNYTSISFDGTSKILNSIFNVTVSATCILKNCNASSGAIYTNLSNAILGIDSGTPFYVNTSVSPTTDNPHSITSCTVSQTCSFIYTLYTNNSAASGNHTMLSYADNTTGLFTGFNSIIIELLYPGVYNNLFSLGLPTLPYSFNVTVNSTNAADTMLCSVTDNSSLLSCLDVNISSSSPSANSLCTVSSSIDAYINTQVQCNDVVGTNSTNRTISVSSYLANFTSMYPDQANTSFIYSNDSTNFDFSCSIQSILANISSSNLYCIDTTDNIVYNKTFTTNGLSYNFLDTTTNLSIYDEYKCTMSCMNTLNVSNSTSINTTTIDNIQSNLTNFDNRTNSQFQINITYGFFDQLPTCTGITNTSAITCDTVTGGQDNATVTCTPIGTVDELFNIYGQCNSTYVTWNYSQINTSSVNIWFDNAPPIIQILSPPSDGSGVYYNVSNVNLKVNFTDTNIFALNITCYNYSTNIVHFSDEIQNVNVTNYLYNNYTLFSNPGLIQCNATVADDHTANEYSKFVNVNKHLVDNKRLTIEKNKGEKNQVEIIYDERNTIPINDLTYELQMDRVSPIFHLDTKGINGEYQDIFWTVEFEGNIISREETSGIPGHILLIPDNYQTLGDIQWYDAVDEFEYSTVTKEIQENKILYHQIVRTDELLEKNGLIKTKSVGGININSTVWNFTILQGTNITFYEHNIWNGSTINTFNITWSNASASTIYQTTTGNLTIEYGSETTTFFASLPNYLNTYTITALNNNDSGTYNLSFWQAKLNVYAYNYQDNSSITGASVSAKNNTIIKNSTTQPATFYLNINDYNITVSGSNIVENSSYYTGITTVGEYNYEVYVFSNLSVCFMDEFTEQTFNVSSPDSITQYVFCTDDTVFRNNMTSSCNAYSVACNISKVKYVVQYPTDRYYRTLLSDAFNVSTGNVTVWLVNLDTTQIIFNTFQVYALNEEFDNMKVFFKKNIGDVEYIITSDYLNIEDKIGTYLILGEEYTVTVEEQSIGSVTLGFYTADTSGEKVIKLFDINFNSNPTGTWLNNSWWVETDNSTDPPRIKVTYDSTDVSSATLVVYNGSINSSNQLYTTTSSAEQGIIYFQPSASQENYTFVLRMNITKDDPTTQGNPVFTTTWRVNPNILLDIIGLGFVSTTFLAWFITILLGVVALIFTWYNTDIGGLIFVGLGGIFMSFGWVYIATITFALSMIVAIVNFLKKKDLERR